MDLYFRVLTRAKRWVSLNKVSNVPSIPALDGKRQIPLVQDTLIRELFLKKNVEPFEDVENGSGDRKSLASAASSASNTPSSSPLRTRKMKTKKKKDKCKVM